MLLPILVGLFNITNQRLSILFEVILSPLEDQVFLHLKVLYDLSYCPLIIYSSLSCLLIEVERGLGFNSVINFVVVSVLSNSYGAAIAASIGGFGRTRDRNLVASRVLPFPPWWDATDIVAIQMK